MRAKICRITDLFTALNAEDHGADFIGLVLDKKSDAYISPFRAEVIAQQIRTACTVGVFRNEELKTVNHWVNKIGLDYDQLDGKLCLKLQPYAFDASIGTNVAYGVKNFLRHLKGNMHDEVLLNHGRVSVVS